jgi:hypothetical protein
MRAYLQPLWTGERLPSGRLLLWGEQGVGDEIMFAGLLPDVILTGSRITLDCDPRLQPLFARSFPEIEVISSPRRAPDPTPGPELVYGQNSRLRTPSERNEVESKNLPLAEPSAERVGERESRPAYVSAEEAGVVAHLPTGSLPGLFRTTESAFAASTSPYLKPHPDERDRFRSRYFDGRHLVGLAWQTRNRKTGRKRSIELSALASLFELPGIRWVSLQYGGFDDLEQQAARAGAPVLVDRAVDQFADIDLFAAQVSAMDCVLTVDNSTAHLAGALGIPVWLMLPFAADWRWQQKRPNSLWYPSMRLFRQPRPGDWQSPIESVCGAFKAALACP